ncbi:protein ALP1-like [Chenopodium quinoa]|uniref:protein ALP1-like n=1 Tax=Chenopodium quinoa TaxID=63459 RepID=UPI000B7980D9|nr:protein ALP1-like [Chenopodium quinoa]
MSEEVSTWESLKRVRDDDEDMEFIVVVIGTWRYDDEQHGVYQGGRMGLHLLIYVAVIVALFLHILAQDLKNRTIQAIFARSAETMSRQFHIVLQSILKIGKHYIKQVDQTTSFAEDNKWKWFEGVVGALDGTHIKMTVPIEDRPRYRDRKGDLSTNVLAACDSDLRFTYVLPGWEGSVSDPRVLHDALRRPNGLKIPRNKYFLVDLGFSNCEGFLAPYKGTLYHLNLWRGNTPTNYMELLNLRHSSARNTIERAFGLLKKR